MSAVTIRPYEENDVEAVKSLIYELQAYERQLELSLTAPTDAFVEHYLARLLSDTQTDGIILVAIEDGAVCGDAAGARQEDIEEASPIFYVIDLCVAEAVRGRGIGSDLMGALEAFARGQGYTRLMVGALSSNARAHQLYKRLGFRDYVVKLVKDL